MKKQVKAVKPSEKEIAIVEKQNGEVFVDVKTKNVRVKMYFRNGVQMLFPQEWDNE